MHCEDCGAPAVAGDVLCAACRGDEDAAWDDDDHGHDDPEPIPCRGALGLWTPPPDVLARLGAFWTAREMEGATPC